MDNTNDVRKMYVAHLRVNKPGNQAMWSKEELLAGLHYFYELNGSFPTAHEIDTFKYLPSSRSIQRSYGGLVKLRSELLPSEIANYTKGSYRSQTAKRTYANGRAYERAFFEYLTSKFKEIAVHEHKLIRPGDVSCDFFIYMDDNTGVAIDIFYADSIVNLINVVNIKIKRYRLIQPRTYLVCVGNESITQVAIAAKTSNRQAPLPDHVFLVSEEYFKDVVIPQLQQQSIYNLV